MHNLTKIILDDMKPALGVTEPAAIALAAAEARRHIGGEALELRVSLNSGMYKNAFTCGVPNSREGGIKAAAALGLAAGDPDRGLEVLSDIDEAGRKAAEGFIKRGIIRPELSHISSDIYVDAELRTDEGSCEVLILHEHTFIKYIKVNGKLIYGEDICKAELINNKEEAAAHSLIHDYTLQDILLYIENVGINELLPLKEAYTFNLQLFEAALSSDRTPITKVLFKENGCKRVSEDELKTAQLLCTGALEGRVIGLDFAAMSITGSGSHGIICTMPLYAIQQIRYLAEDKLLRATALSYLITIYIKEYSGRLSAFCGCGIAAGTGMACGAAWLKGGDEKTLELVINNMAAGITGMICDGGNHGCVMKGIIAVDTAWRSVGMALNGTGIESIHGICGVLPEETMRNMGRIADPGMRETERTILDIMCSK